LSSTSSPKAKSKSPRRGRIVSVPKTEIFFLDRNYQPTTDRVTGTPSVYATVAIDGLEVMSGRPAVVDTGADFCIINAGELSPFRDQVRPADKSKIEHPYLRGEQADVYEATIIIHGLDGPVPTYFIPRNLRPPILIGRHVLERYNMIYNPLGGVFSLEKS
jgi:hypothetical protein